jgi:tRNA pseudouridine13 synthase
MEGTLLTSHLPGTGGRIRERLEDFVVEEIPLYEPSGVGEHLYLRVRKAGISTHEAVHRVARAAGVPGSAIGYAGLKDARAIAVQTLSVAGVRDEPALDDPDVSIVSAKRHGNKLRPGHLAGNRFSIRIRDVGPEAAERAAAVLSILSDRGVPNRFGPQRFGSKGDADLVGRALVRGDAAAAVEHLLGTPGPHPETGRLAEARSLYREGDLAGAERAFPRSFRAERQVLGALRRGQAPDRAIRRLPKAVRKLVIAAWQSRLFNRLLDSRIETLGTLEAGDLAWLHDRGAVFSVLDPGAEQPRADRFEISPSGPIYGRKSKLASGEPGRRERELLEAEGIALRDFGAPGVRMEGERRPFRVPLGDPQVRAEGEDVVLVSFSLPRGSFATAVLFEVMKAEGLR